MKKLRLAAFVLLTLAHCSSGPELPKLFPVPDTELIASSGRPFNLATLRGKVVVYDFIFTRCGGTCPVMTASMEKLAGNIDRGLPVRFVSITVDPAHDSPAVLDKFRARLKNADERWIFLTGENHQIVKLSVHGFKLAATNSAEARGEAPVHSSKLVLVDKTGTIRGYYDGTSADQVDKLLVHAKALSTV